MNLLKISLIDSIIKYLLTTKLLFSKNISSIISYLINQTNYTLIFKI